MALNILLIIGTIALFGFITLVAVSVRPHNIDYSAIMSTENDAQHFVAYISSLIQQMMEEDAPQIFIYCEEQAKKIYIGHWEMEDHNNSLLDDVPEGWGKWPGKAEMTLYPLNCPSLTAPTQLAKELWAGIIKYYAGRMEPLKPYIENGVVVLSE